MGFMVYAYPPSSVVMPENDGGKAALKRKQTI
jgi:hypothetical protein